MTTTCRPSRAKTADNVEPSTPEPTTMTSVSGLSKQVLSAEYFACS